MNSTIDLLQKKSLHEISKSTSESELDSLRIKYLGRKGEINALMQKLPNLPKEKRGLFGREVNSLKQTIKKALVTKQSQLSTSTIEQLSKEEIDVTTILNWTVNLK